MTSRWFWGFSCWKEGGSLKTRQKYIYSDGHLVVGCREGLHLSTKLSLFLEFLAKLTQC